MAYENNNIIGAVLCGHDGRRGYLNHLAVQKGFRKKGIGKRLVCNCLKKLREKGISKCNIFLFKDNREGGKFWNKAGWKEMPNLVLLQKST